MIIERFQQEDFSALQALVAEAGSLDRHTSYTYWVAAAHWPDLFLVARDGAVLVGFIFGAQISAGEVFAWQVGVAPSQQGKGLGGQLFDAFAQAALALGADTLSMTITEDNQASHRLCKSFATSRGSVLEPVGETGDMGGIMKTERRYRIRLR